MHKLKEHRPVEAGLEDVDDLTIEEISEGAEPKLFFEGVLLKCIFTETINLAHL